MDHTVYNFEQAIRKVLDNLNSNIYNFVLETEFGTTHFTMLSEDYDKMRPVVVVKRTESRRLEWLDLSDYDSELEIKYVVGIGNCFLSQYAARIHTAEAMVKLMFLSIIDTVPSEEIIDACVSMYCKITGVPRVRAYNFEKEFMSNNVDLLLQKNETVRMLVQKIILDRMKRSNAITEKITETIQRDGISLIDYRFKSDLYINLFGALVYYLKENPFRSSVMPKNEICDIFMK